MNEPRYRVQFYTERHDGTTEYCVCDFRDEHKTGMSPKIRDAFGLGRESTTDRAEAQRLADRLNANPTAHPDMTT